MQLTGTVPLPYASSPTGGNYGGQHQGDPGAHPHPLAGHSLQAAPVVPGDPFRDSQAPPRRSAAPAGTGLASKPTWFLRLQWLDRHGRDKKGWHDAGVCGISKIR